MYYPDLTVYRDDESGSVVNIYPAVRNIGWLGYGEPYTMGNVQNDLIQKLKEIIFLDLKNTEDKKNDLFDKNKAVLVHLLHMRGSPYQCPFCNNGKVVTIVPTGLKYYSGQQNMLTGLNEVSIPSLKEGEFYSFPTMLYHYIVEHGYMPPQEFLDALIMFDLDQPYDIDIEQEELDCVEVSASEVNKI